MLHQLSLPQEFENQSLTSLTNTSEVTFQTCFILSVQFNENFWLYEKLGQPFSETRLRKASAQLQLVPVFKQR